MTNSLLLTAATGTQDVFCIKVALLCHLVAQLHQITDLLIPLAHISLQHLQKYCINIKVSQAKVMLKLQMISNIKKM
jgi:hypothetical protein